MSTEQHRTGEELAAVFVNRFNVTLGEFTRIVFSERISKGSDKDYARAALILSRENALELARVILKLSKQRDEGAQSARKNVN
jgi:hypothetical protein